MPLFTPPLSDGGAGQLGPPAPPSDLDAIDVRKLVDLLLNSSNDDDQIELDELPGQRDCALVNLRAKILDHYRTPGGFTVGKVRDHLHFLYLTHSMRKSDDEIDTMAVVDSNLRIVKPHLRDIYLPSNDPLSPGSLLDPSKADRTHSQLPLPAPSAASVLHPVFMQDIPQPRNTAHPTWEHWLCESLGVRRDIPLVDGRQSLSDAFLYVSIYQPRHCLPLLHRLWPAVQKLDIDLIAIRQLIRQLPVLSTSGEFQPMEETYLPLENLRSHAARLQDGGIETPFLQLPKSLDDEEMLESWAWLSKEFKVGSQYNMGFLLDILGRIRDEAELSLDVCRILAIIYCEIEAQCESSPEPDAVRGIAR